MTWFQASLLSLLYAKAPSVNTLLRVLCNQLTDSAAGFPLLIHLLIHSSSEGWLKTYYIGYLGFCLPPSPIHKWFPDFLRGTSVFPHPQSLSSGRCRPYPSFFRGRAFDPGWPTRALHLPSLRDWFRDGHVTQRRPIQDSGTQFWDFRWTVRKVAFFPFCWQPSCHQNPKRNSRQHWRMEKNFASLSNII